MVGMDERQRVLERYGTGPGPEGCRLAAAVIVPTDQGPAVAFIAGECPPEPWASRITNPQAWAEPRPPHVLDAVEDQEVELMDRGVVAAPRVDRHPSGWIDAGRGRSEVSVRGVVD